MEESGKISYWSVLFRANSFTDLLDTINKISEIAAHDQAMLAELDQVAQEIQTAQAELAQEKSELDAQKQLWRRARRSWMKRAQRQMKF